MIIPGPRNLITDVDGILVGNAQDIEARTGTTVILPEAAAVAAVDIRGGAPGTCDTALLDPANMVREIHAIALSGGSAFGLEAASGVMGWLREAGRGLAVNDVSVPIVPAAILFDLANGGDKQWRQTSPYKALGRAACGAAARDFSLGNAGAGLGAIAGQLKGGLGSASAITDDGMQIGALVVANPVGSTIMPGEPVFWAWDLEQAGEFGNAGPPKAPAGLEPAMYFSGRPSPLANTTLGVVATNMALDKSQAQRVAIMAQDGIARAIRPAHTPYDGDLIFCIATDKADTDPPDDLGLARLGAIAADCIARAIARGVYEARGFGDAIPDYRDIRDAAM
ncbi:MAG: P1 family peptidase [Alphaproteobacteria bacterium]